MTAIKHISFDVWKTLINPNKSYGSARNEIIARHLDIPVQEAKDLYKMCKKFLDKSAEINGTCFSTPNCWQLLVKMSGKKVDYLPMMNECADLFKHYLPEFDSELVKELQKLKESGYVLSITSNTNFVSGKVLFNDIFKAWDVFAYTHFSDLNEVAKPNPRFFDITYNHAAFGKGTVPEQVSHDVLKRSEILHVGDNKICDAQCVDSGFQYLYVEDPADLLVKLQKEEVVPVISKGNKSSYSLS